MKRGRRSKKFLFPHCLIVSTSSKKKEVFVCGKGRYEQRDNDKVF